MSNRKTNELLWEIQSKIKKSKGDLKAFQHACPHKKRNGVYAIKNDSKNPYVFRCKICGSKIDLSIVNAENGSVKEQLKGAFKTIKSACDLAKLNSDVKDKKTVAMIGSFLTNTKSMTKFLSKVIKTNNEKGKKKVRRIRANVSTNINSIKL